MQLLTKNLKEEVMSDIYSKVLKQSKFFRRNLSDETINNLSQYVREKKNLPEEQFFKRNEIPTKLWFILNGKTEYFAGDSNEDDEDS